MTRRANLPGAAELFRVTDPRPAEPVTPTAPTAPTAPAPAAAPVPVRDPSGPVPIRRGATDALPGPADGGRAGGAVAKAPADSASTRRQPSGRQRHEEKITVYISPEELHDLEHARLVLRREHGVRADRGRLVREALAVVLSDLEAHGEESILVRRFREQ